MVADRGLTLGDLLGVIYAFFKKLGIEKLRFKPAYNPYTEPSMEIFSYHEGMLSLIVWLKSSFLGSSFLFASIGMCSTKSDQTDPFVMVKDGKSSRLKN